MREIVFDTETTGLDPLAGDRLVEIGCIELFNRFPTGKTFHGYFNPERDMPESALKIHGLTVDFLKNQPLFAHRVGELIDFLFRGFHFHRHFVDLCRKYEIIL